MNNESYIIPFDNVNAEHISLVGGKNASLGEMIQSLGAKSIRVPSGFAVTTSAYWDFLDAGNLREPINEILENLDMENFNNLEETSRSIKRLVMEAVIPDEICNAIKHAYRELAGVIPHFSVAVRSSATAEDLPSASFAGQQESFLNISGEDALIKACHRCFASLFTERAIKYRIDHGFDHMQVALSVGVQQMVRSDRACSGVAFTLEPESGFRDIILINGIWGLGENIVQGIVDPDEFLVFKKTLIKDKNAIISKNIGEKHLTMIYGEADSPTRNIETPAERRSQQVLSDVEITQLASWCLEIEQHYGTPMDIEWAKDGLTEEIFIVQARPETVHSQGKPGEALYSYQMTETGPVLTTGIGLGNKITSGKARLLNNPAESHKLSHGDILVTGITTPDWDPIMKKVGGIITDKGGRTSHAAIVARELGVVAVVGTGDATKVIQDGQPVTVSCAEGKQGKIYDGELKWSKQKVEMDDMELPDTKVMYILADPSKAFQYSLYPNHGIGLMRMEFIISNLIRIHPMALIKFDELADDAIKRKIISLTANYPNKSNYFTDQLSQAVAITAAAFYPRPVIVRMSDFKSNEYANLIGGHLFEPREENPMLGLRGASRYYNDLYRAGFRLECEAMRIVRDEMGLTNVKLMIPFCRTVEEGKKVIQVMDEFGLKQGKNGLEIYTMIEIPSNVILAEEFAEVFDGFSIGSNDLTQLTLGLDRDSELVNDIFDENNAAVKKLISMVIRAAHNKGIPIGLCGQAPSDFPEFAQFLVREGISSISFNPDALFKGIANINEAERRSSKDTSPD